MKAYYYADKITREIFEEAFEFESVSVPKNCDVMILASSGGPSPKILDANPSRYCSINFNEEEDFKIRALYSEAKLGNKTVFAFGKCAAIVGICNGARYYHQCNNHFGKHNQIWDYDPLLQSFKLRTSTLVRSLHTHCLDVTSLPLTKWELVAASFDSTMKKRYELNGSITDRNLIPTRSKSFYNCDPEVYVIRPSLVSKTICFEFFLSEQNLDFVSGTIVKHSGIKWENT